LVYKIDWRSCQVKSAESSFSEKRMGMIIDRKERFEGRDVSSGYDIHETKGKENPY
jgi:hypothetical protein